MYLRFIEISRDFNIEKQIKGAKNVLEVCQTIAINLKMQSPDLIRNVRVCRAFVTIHLAASASVARGI